jgi:hypothetical protein
MTDLTALESEAVRGLVKALEVAGDGDMTIGLEVMTGVLKLVRTTGQDNPLKGLEEIREALATAHTVRTMGRFSKWLALALVGVIMTGAQMFDALGRLWSALRGTGRAP